MQFSTPQGEVYGFVDKEGNIHLDETIINPSHPIHEYTHMWDRFVAQKNPKLWKCGISIMQQLALWNEIARSENYGKKWVAQRDLAYGTPFISTIFSFSYGTFDDARA